jgi:polysaccharide export outer membrane protein
MFFGRLLPTLMTFSLAMLLLPWTALLAQDQGDQKAQPAIAPAAQPVGPPRQDDTANVQDLSKPAEITPPPDYVVGPEDVLQIDVFDVKELSTLLVRVDNDGTIGLPLIGRVRASGLNSQELKKQLEADWGKSYLENPQVSVFVKEFHAQRVAVIGAVEEPGLYDLTSARTLIDMLSMAGGLSKRVSGASGRYVYITRKVGFEDLAPAAGMRLLAPDKLEVEIRRLLYSGDASLNIEIKAFDIVSVSKADIVYVAGSGVKKPAGFILEDRDKVTVLQALAMAEGFSSNALKKSAFVVRTQPDGSTKRINVDLGKVVKGRAPDIEMAGNDILYVPKSAEKAGLKRGMEAALGTISGLIVFHTY